MPVFFDSVVYQTFYVVWSMVIIIADEFYLASVGIFLRLRSSLLHGPLVAADVGLAAVVDPGKALEDLLV